MFVHLLLELLVDSVLKAADSTIHVSKDNPVRQILLKREAWLYIEKKKLEILISRKYS